MDVSRRIIFPAKSEVRLESFEPRPPAPGEVLVQTRYSLMSIGTETTILHAKYDPGTHFAARFSFPQIKTGVQAVGIVEAAGPEVADFGVGSIVFMRMGHASHCTLPALQCSVVPAGIDLKSACWCGLAKTAFRAAHAAPFTLGGQVLIIGAGPVGQMAIRWARSAGMGTIVVIDVSAERLRHAALGSAIECLQGPVESLRGELIGRSGGDGFQIVVDTTGNPAVFPEALGVTGMFGRVILLGDTGYPRRQCLTSDMMTKGLTVIATHDHHDRGGWTQRRIDALFFERVRAGVFALDGLITHEFAPEHCPEAYALASDQREQAVGVLFDWTRA
jgi:2-desacetyl-2-hydroxyethyl bacteriochlorophyllide A dehydrogenase